MLFGKSGMEFFKKNFEIKLFVLLIIVMTLAIAGTASYCYIRLFFTKDSQEIP